VKKRRPIRSQPDATFDKVERQPVQTKVTKEINTQKFGKVYGPGRGGGQGPAVEP
jgi:hypothetical protein